MEDVCRMPVLVAEDSLAGWRALKHCLSAQTDLMFVRCPAPSSEILKHCSRLMPCILAIEQTALEQVDPNRFKQTVDYGRSVSVLVRVVREDAETLERLLRLGCMGYVAERASSSVVGQAIRALARGEIWANPRVLADLVRVLLTTESPRILTGREAEILRLISRGRSNRQIAEELFISRETVRWHIRTLYAKIGVHDRAEAVNHAASLEQEPQLLFGFGDAR